MKEHLEAAAKILATDNDHNLEELWIEAQQAIEDEGDAAQYDPSVLLYELYLATAKEIVEAWVGGRDLLTRTEWEATIDYKAAGRRLVEWAYEPEGTTTAAEATIQIVDAAVGEANHEPT